MWKVSNYRGGKLSTQSYNATFFWQNPTFYGILQT